MMISNKKRKYIKRNAEHKSPSQLAQETGLPLQDVLRLLKEYGHACSDTSDTDKAPKQHSDRYRTVFFVLLCATLIITPLFYIAGLYDMYSLPKFALLISVAPMLAVVYMMHVAQQRRFDLFRCFTFPLLPLFLFLLMGLLSLTWSVNRYEALWWIIKWSYVFLFFFTTLHMIEGHKQIRIIAAIITIAGVAVSVLGIFQFFGINPEFIYQAAVPGATFGNKNFAAQFIVGTIPFSVYAAYCYRTKLSGYVFSFFFFVLMFFLVITRTRGAWLASIAGLSLGAAAVAIFCYRSVKIVSIKQWLRRRENVKQLLLFILPGFFFFLTTFAIVSIPQTTQDKVKHKVDLSAEIRSIGETKKGSAQWRITAWKNTLFMIKTHPFGVGAGNWQFYYPLFAQRGAVDTVFSEDRQAKRAHNDYLQIAAEIGLPGIIFFLWFIANILFICIKLIVYSHDKNRALLGVTVLSALICMLGNAMFSFPMQETLPPFFLAIISSLAACAFFRDTDKNTYTVRSVLSPTISVPIIVFGFLFVYSTTKAYALCMADYYFLIGKRYNTGDMFEKSLRPLRTSLTYNPDNFRTYSLLGRSLNELNRYKESISINRRALELHPYYINCMNNLGNALRGTNQIDEAIKVYNDALRLFPNFAEAHNNLGIAFKQQGDVEQAKQEYLKAIELDPEYDKAYNNLGNLFLAENDLDKAVEYYEKAIQMNPDLSDVYNNIGLAMINQEKYEKAIEYFDKCINLKTRLPDPFNNKGTALRKLDKLDEAIVYFKQALTINNRYLPAYNNLAETYYMKEDYALSADNYRKIVEIKPNLKGFYQKAAQMYLDAYATTKDPNDIDNAIEVLQDGLSQFPDYTNFYTMMGKVYIESNQSEKALEMFRKVIEIEPQRGDAYYNIGVAYHHNNQLTDAIRYYQKALDLTPDFVFLHFEIAKLYEKLGMYEKAINHLTVFVNTWKGDQERKDQAMQKLQSLKQQLSQ